MGRRKRMHGRRRKRSPINFYMGRETSDHVEQYGKHRSKAHRVARAMTGGGANSVVTQGSYGGGAADRNLQQEYKLKSGGMGHEADTGAMARNRQTMQARSDYVASTFVYKKRK